MGVILDFLEVVMLILFFFWCGGFYVFEVVLKFKDIHGVFVLYEYVYGL